MTHKPPTIEDRLTAQARGIFAAQPVDSAAAQILAEYACRDRRRRTRRKAAAGLLACALLAAILDLPLRQDEVASPQKAVSDTRAAAIAPAMTEGEMLLTQLSEAALRDAGGEGAVAIPLLVTVGEWKGQRVVAPMVYVPAHARRIGHASLTTSEQSAVERLLKVTSTTRDRGYDITL